MKTTTRKHYMQSALDGNDIVLYNDIHEAHEEARIEFLCNHPDKDVEICGVSCVEEDGENYYAFKFGADSSDFDTENYTVWSKDDKKMNEKLFCSAMEWDSIEEYGMRKE